MLTLTPRHQIMVGLTLLLALMLTRGQHIASIDHLPEAAWAVFFLAGIYISAAWFLVVLFSSAALVDYFAIVVGGVDSFCFTPAYSLLLPAYGALWLAGRMYATYYQYNWQTLIPLSLCLFSGAFICELLSSGGFYTFSGHFTNPTLAEFGERLVQYFPANLSNLVFYMFVAILIHSTVLILRKFNHQRLDVNVS